MTMSIKTSRLVHTAAGATAGSIITAVALLLAMPALMLVDEQSALGFEETVAALESNLKAQGWSSPGTLDLTRSINQKGVDFTPRVSVVQLCQPQYAASVLTTDRHVAGLMPCTIAVYEDDDGGVHVAKMNTGLMGRLFGGNIAKVMGGSVARDEQAILESVTAH